MSAGDERVEHVDSDGRVLGIVTRSEMRRRNLRHRCTYVVVIDSDERVVVHRRADWKDVYPGWWDVAFGGVCGVVGVCGVAASERGEAAVGEDWVGAARRELAEEAGIEGVALWPLGSVRYDADDGHLVGEVYLARTDAEPSCPDGEVVEIDRVPLGSLAAWLNDRNVCLDSRTVVVPLLECLQSLPSSER